MISQNFSRILPKLYQGARPPEGTELRDHHFDVVVLCAEEYQPPDEAFPGVEVLRCPFGDDSTRPLRAETRKMIAETAARVAERNRSGKRVYVSCQMGINRSGLVMALAVRELTAASGREAREWVQSRRQGSLRNRHFSSLLDALPLGRKRANQARLQQAR